MTDMAILAAIPSPWWEGAAAVILLAAYAAISARFITRHEAMRMHAENQQQLQAIEARQDEIEGQLDGRLRNLETSTAVTNERLGHLGADVREVRDFLLGRRPGGA